MMRITDRSGRERLEPDGYILQDGESCRVPMMFMDDKAPTNPRNLTDAQMKRYNDAYNTYLTNLTTAWQKNREPLPEKLEPASGRSGVQRWGAHSTCDSSSTVLRGSSGSVLRLRSIRVPGPG